MNLTLNALAAQEHVADLTRAAAQHYEHPTRQAWRSGPVVELRPARADDDPALRRLAALDEADELQGPALVAVVGGEPVAAIALDDERVIANPFVPTAQAVALLRMRASHLSHVSRRRRRIRFPRLRLA
jgi:hypothetical protein